MTKRKRATPYMAKAKGGKKTQQKTSEIEEAKIDAAKNISRMEIITEEELLRIKTITARNALNLFNKLLEEFQLRIPTMTDEVLTASMLSVWEKSGGKK